MIQVSHRNGIEKREERLVKRTHCHSCGLPDEAYIGRDDDELCELLWLPEHDSVLEKRVSVGSSMLDVYVAGTNCRLQDMIAKWGCREDE